MLTMAHESRLRAAARNLLLDAAYGSAPAQAGPFGRLVRWGDPGSVLVREALASGAPLLVARFGTSELACVSFYTRWRSGVPVRLPYPKTLSRVMTMNAGVFPGDDDTLDRFARVYVEAVSTVDIMGVWFNRNEHRIIRRCCPGADLIHLESLNTVIRKEPWSSALAGKTVLVVHPFAKTIESQYRGARPLLFEDPRVLPEFELKAIPAIQSAAGAECGFRTWFDAFERMREQISKTEFDVAIIGAGAYGLPLAAAVKGLGRQAVQLGGATQLLFGIRGRRWEAESPDDVALLFNEHWVRPSAEETPENATLVEGGCYW